MFRDFPLNPYIVCKLVFPMSFYLCSEGAILANLGHLNSLSPCDNLGCNTVHTDLGVSSTEVNGIGGEVSIHMCVEVPNGTFVAHFPYGTKK